MEIFVITHGDKIGLKKNAAFVLYSDAVDYKDSHTHEGCEVKVAEFSKDISILNKNGEVIPNANELISDFITSKTAQSISASARKNDERPFGYVIDWFKDNGIPKTSGWSIAVAICKHYFGDNWMLYNSSFK